ncbi:MAG TPA: hypothetical protein VMY06_14585 [Sedimentisphaerales bacterium]|nr:hypothetical protein [Sedimentisphaerales bacterium]HUU15552.1 hypothetical protein [Sedimentisphaerales bacterium]
MSLTLIEASKLMINRGEVQRSAVVETYAMSSDILRVLPFRDIAGNAYAYNQEQTLPGIGFRGINAGYTASTGIINPQVEPLVIAGGDLSIDPFIIKTGGEGVRERHQIMKIKALAHAWTLAFIKGSSVTTPASLDGLQVRLTGAQLTANGTTNGGDPLSLLNLDTLIDSVDNPTHLIMNKKMRRRLSVAARTAAVGGNITWTKDEFGKAVMLYDELPIIIADRDHTGADILNFLEVSNNVGVAATATSIYCISVGDGMIEGIQNGNIDVRMVGEQAATVTELTRVEWYNGICIEHPRAAARLWSISDAVAVA